MLAIAIHRDHRIESERACAAETIAQALTFAERSLVTDQRDRQIRHVLYRRVRGTIVDDDHVRAYREHGCNDTADRALFVERRNHDCDAARIGRAHGVTSMRRAVSAPDAMVTCVVSRRPSATSSGNDCAAIGLPISDASDVGASFDADDGFVVCSDNRASECGLRVGLSTNATANGSALGATSASGPRAAMSYALSSTVSSSACAWIAASSKPAAKLPCDALIAVAVA